MPLSAGPGVPRSGSRTASAAQASADILSATTGWVLNSYSRPKGMTPPCRTGASPVCPQRLNSTIKGTSTMASLLTNSAAMTALQTLRSVSANMQTTENRISTGQRVATASDNAAYWSIATSMRADNSALSAVSDSLGLSAATVDTEYTALTAVLGNEGTSGLNKLQALLVEAKTAGIDRNKIQSEITQIQQDMKNTANSATFNGVNWVSTNATTPATVNLVSSFSRVGGTPTINTIQVTVANYSLYTSTQTGFLDTVSGATTVSIDTMNISALTDSVADQVTLDGLIAQVVAAINTVS